MSAVPAGYKQTEVGVIPEDWSCNTVDQLVNDSILAKPLDGNHGNIHPKSGDFVSHGIPFVMANNVRDGCVDLTNCAFIRKEQADSLQKGFSLPGDVLLTHKATIGQTAVVGVVPYEYIMLTPQVTYYRVIDGERLNNEYLRQYFEGANFQRVLQSLSGGGTRSYIGITAQRELPVVVPSSVIEQRAIAAALSDVDALLAKLDQFIAKKRDLKQAAMQQLLTGQTRLPGFSGEWEVKRLGDVLRFQVGFPFGSEFFNQEGDGVRLIKNRDLKADDQIFFFSGKFDDTFLVSNGDVLIGMDGDFLPCLWSKGKALLNQRVGRVVPSTSLSAVFSYYMLTEPLKEIEYATSATTVKHLSHGDVEGIECALPAIEEQTAIATVLSDMDAELAALEARRDKTRSLKQGMMQELLTGRVRLVGPDAYNRTDSQNLAAIAAT